MNTTTPLQIQKIHRPFTLVELLAVITILVILMGIGIGAFSYANRRIADARTRALIKQIEMAQEAYKQEFGYYVQMATIGNLVVETTTTAGQPKDDFSDFLDFETLKGNNTSVSGSYYTFIDGFGMNLLYRCPGLKNKTSFDLISRGADAKYGDNSAVTDASTEPQKYAQLGQGDDITNFTP